MQKEKTAYQVDAAQATTKIRIVQTRSLLIILILLSGDLLSFSLAFLLASLTRSLFIPVIGGAVNWSIFTHLLELNLISLLITYTLTGLYPGFGLTAVEEMRKIFNALTLGYGLLGVAIYFQKVGPNFSRSVFIISWMFACILNILTRFAIRNRASLFSWWGIPLVVVGPMSEARDVITRLLNCRRMGLRPVLVLDKQASPETKDLLGVPVVQNPEVMQEAIAIRQIQYAVFIESNSASQEEIRNQLSWLSKLFPTILVVLADSPLGSLWVKTIDLEGRLTLQAQYHLLNKSAIFSKRAFDLVLGALVALITLPVMSVIAIVIKLESRGPVFYAHDRIGLNGKMFRYWKFRTMVADADSRLDELLQNDIHTYEQYQKFHKIHNDPRITRLGKLLRKYSLDELPQIWNVLKGEMSLVGPRAYLPSEYAEMGNYANIILQIRPGVTGWWQVMGRHTTTFQHRLQLDEYYLSNWSLWLDVYVVIKTLWVVLTGGGA
jgi:Undecaprenyl-phosphate galactose phosphotransferase WbaP